MKLPLLLVSAALLGLAGTAVAGTLCDASYVLYYQAPGGDVPIRSDQSLPPGSNIAPNNIWRFEYTVQNLGPSPLNAYYAFFNSDNVLRATYVSGTKPTNWSITKQGPFAPNNNFKIRYLALSQDVKILTGGSLASTCVFSWVGTAVPGPQNYDAVTDGGSESGVTREMTPVPVLPATWGSIKALYRSN